MVNTQVIEEIEDALKIDRRVERAPSPLPVIEVGVKSIKNCITASQSNTSATSATLFTTSNDCDTYLTGASLTWIRDASATSTLFAIYYVDENGLNKILLSVGGITLTAGSGSTITPPMHPIKLKRGSNVTITSTTNVANFKLTGQIYYFIDEIS